MIKEIQKLKIALTSNCTLRCSHCNIDKDSGLDISEPAAFKAAEILLSSEGSHKRLEIYGGEPFTRFPILKKITARAFKLAKSKNKKLSLHIATNATVVTPEILDWIKKNRVHVAVSFSGSKKSHDFNRKFPGGGGSHDLVLANIRKIISSAGTSRFVCIYCVAPAFSANLLSDFREIRASGARIIDVECVHGAGWKKKDYKVFSENFLKLNSEILALAKKGEFIFYESFIEYARLKGFGVPFCPGYMDLEIYPDGAAGFYPYAFIDYRKNKKNVVIGSALSGFSAKYRNCVYPGPACENCVSEYYRLKNLSDGAAAYEIRNRLSERLFREMLSLAVSEKYAKEYMKALARILKLFYGENSR